MSVTVTGDRITLTRGDSLILNVSIIKDGSEYELNEGDRVRFALNKNKLANSDPIILKELDPKKLQLTLTPEETKKLEYKTYYYDFELTTVDGYVDTFIGPATFKITEEVY